MFQLRKSENLLITRDLANTFATMTPSPTERPFSEKRLQFLQGKFDAHLFINLPRWRLPSLGGRGNEVAGGNSRFFLA